MLPEYCDQRAEKHFSRYLVGGDRGDNGSAYKVDWSSTSGAEVTPTTKIGYSHYCVFCANKAFPIQKSFRPAGSWCDDYILIGHACVCKKAMDHVDISKEVKELKTKQKEALRVLENKLPKVTKDGANKLLNIKHKVEKQEVVSDSSDPLYRLERVGIKLSEVDK